MVYAVAAYSITLGVLLIYGVLVQYRVRVARAQSVARSAGERAASAAVATELLRGFNLGAALLAPLWALVHGPRAAAVGLIAAWVAFAAAGRSGVQPASLALASFLIGSAFFFGAAGNRMLAARGEAGDPFGMARGQMRWALAGALLYTVVLPWAGYFASAAG